MSQNVALLTRDGSQNVALLERAAVAVAPTITTTALPSGAVGVAYSQTIQRTGDAPVFTLSAGSLPAGLALNASTGVISGTPTEPVNAQFEVTATNTAGSNTKALSVVVPNEGGVRAAPAVTTVTLSPAASVDQGSTADLPVTVEDQDGEPVVNIAGSVVSSDPAVATASLAAPTDGTGQAVVVVTGVSAGRTTLTTTFDGVSAEVATVEVTALTVPTIDPVSLPYATVGVAYSAQVTATGNPAPTLAVTVGDLPPGLSMSTDGLITGTPTGDAQTYDFTVTATSSEGSADLPLSVVVAVVAVAPTITTASPMPGMTIGAAYSVTFAASGTTPILWTVGIGSLPPGLTLNESTGVLSGTPALAGTYTFTVVATNDAGVHSKEFSVVGTLPAGTRLRITTVHPKALTATNLYGTVFAPPTVGKRVGERIGEFSGKVFEPYEGGASMTVLLSEFGGTWLAVGDKPQVYIEGLTSSTHIFKAEVVAS